MIIEVLTRLICDIFEVEPSEITSETNLYEDLGADSLDMVELGFACEEEFEAELPKNKKLWNLKTVGEIAEYIGSHTDVEK